MASLKFVNYNKSGTLLLVLHKDTSRYKYVTKNDSLSIISVDFIKTCYSTINDILQRHFTTINRRMLA